MNSKIERVGNSLAGAVLVLLAGASALAAEPEVKRWNDDQLVASYRELVASGGLDAAILAPTLPKDPPQATFLEALAWYAAGSPDKSGTLTETQFDKFMKGQVASYKNLLADKVERGASNDYPRTRTWKVIQKLTLLENAMTGAPHDGSYAYGVLPRTPAGSDPWEVEHTLSSEGEFGQKVCRASVERPVLVKYGNTNCTQCMLFELMGSVKEIADAHEGVDVYKVWFGFEPDASFAGKIRSPQRLDDLAKAEGVKSSPTFIVYRNGRRYPCGDAFPDTKGIDPKLESCLNQGFGEAPMATVCASLPADPAAKGETR